MPIPIHLRVHTQFSLLAGTASVRSLAEQAAEQGMKTLAITDHNALYGAVAFAKACRKAGVDPILGMTVRISATESGKHPAGVPADLVLLAKNPEGYRSLCRLSSLIQGNPQREEFIARGLGFDPLRDHHEGLICLSGGSRGWISRLLAGGEKRAAARYAGRLAELFRDNFYLALEIQKGESEAILQESIEIGARLGLETAAVQPVYCLDRNEVPSLRLLAAIEHNCTLEELPDSAQPDRGNPDVDLQWLSPEKLSKRFSAYPQALDGIARIAERCGPALPDGSPIWPALSLPPGKTPDQALAEKARAGLVEKYGSNPDPVTEKRLDSELAAIAMHGYAPLFLIVADIVRFAEESEIPTSTRGSVANSLVAYCSAITTVDPIEHDLYFERFLHPARIDMPDIDLDFCSRRRDEVLDYVRKTYGEERMALVATISTLRPRSAVRETAKAFGLNEDQVNDLAKTVPQRVRRRITQDEVLSHIRNPQWQQIVREAFKIEGQPHHLSVHPGGVVIAPGPITDVLPVQWARKGFLITQFDHKDVEALGLSKLDLLGIRALTVLADTVEWVRREQQPDFRLAQIPFDDPPTSDLISRGETIGVFQCESSGAQRTLRSLQARTVRDMAVANAFFKPGPSTGGMADTFVRRYRGEESPAYLHPSLEPILGVTRGVMIFQEQVLRIAREIAGLSWEQADRLRRGMSKFLPHEMDQIADEFVHGCMRSSDLRAAFTQPQADKLWAQIQAFAGYGFNQGHATAYAEVSYRSAYLKTHWPAEFLCARLADRGGYHHPVVYMAEAQRLGMQILPPHINISGARFTLTREEGGRANLWMGLDQVRDLGQSAIAQINHERNESPFLNLRDVLSRVALRDKEIEHLIQCGALEGMGPNRNALLKEMEQGRKAGSVNQMSFFDAAPQVEEETRAQIMAWESKLLGHPVSVTPLHLLASTPEHTPLRQLGEKSQRSISILGYRLPGWTGGESYFLSDGEGYIHVRSGSSQPKPSSWQAVHLQGHWQVEGKWLPRFQVERMKLLG
jgi:DNA polymerase III subunit alpha